jgi:multiple sugar transport system substrate-binding protein
LVQAAKLAAPTRDQWSPADTIKQLHAGQCAMAIGWLSDGNDGTVESLPERTPGNPPAIGVAPLPGSQDVYNFRSQGWEQRSAEEGFQIPLVGISGRIGSLTKECRQPAEAVRLLLWLSGPEMSAQIAAASSATAPFRQSHIAQIDKWVGPLLTRGWLSQDTAKQYADALQQALDEPNCLTGIRIPGRQQYLQTLADNVHKAIAGQISPEAALAAVAQQWQGITESLGVEKQRLAYARSVGLKP